MSLLFVWLAAAALVAGFRALGQITDSHTEQRGRPMALAGIVLAVISVLVWVAAIQW